MKYCPRQLEMFPESISIVIGEKALAEILGVSMDKVREDRLNEEGVTCLTSGPRPRYRREDVISYIINQQSKGNKNEHSD